MNNIHKELEENYDSIMSFQEKKSKAYNYKALIIIVISLIIYLYYYENNILFLWILLLLASVLANKYKFSWYKKWFTDWYLSAKWIDYNDYIENKNE